MYIKTLENQKVQFQNDFSEPKPHLFKSELKIKDGMQNKSKSTCLGRFKFELSVNMKSNTLDILMSRTTSLLFSQRP